MSVNDWSKFVPVLSTEDEVVFDVRISLGRPDLAMYGVDHQGYVRSRAKAMVTVEGHTHFMSSLSLSGILDLVEAELARQANHHFGFTESVQSDSEQKA